jgi:O-antigen ligase
VTLLGAGALLFIVLLWSLSTIEHVPRAVFPWLLALAALAAFTPERALLLIVAFVPVATWYARGWNYLVAWPETLVVAFAAGYLVHCAYAERLARDGMEVAVSVAAVLVVASAVEHFAMLQLRLGSHLMRAQLLDVLRSTYFVGRGILPLDAAMRLIESLLLFRAATSLARRFPRFPLQLAGWFVVGATAAGALNLWRLWIAAQRGDSPLAAFVGYIRTTRLNQHYADLNAAGSYFVMALCIAVALAIRPRGRAWLLAVVPLALAFWVTGSRAALAAGVGAAAIPAVTWLRQRFSGRATLRLALSAAALVMIAGVTLASRAPARGNQSSAGDAFRIRVGLTATSLRMLASRPAFGVGVGQYPNHSGDFSSPELLRLFPAATHENAHNNLLQILAELGIAGFAAFMWVWTLAARRGFAAVRDAQGDPLAWGFATGVIAFALTSFAGHPLLIDEPAFTFWTLLGALAGWSSTGIRGGQTGVKPGSDPGQTWRRRDVLILSAVVVLSAVSIPMRARQLIKTENLEHVGIGLSAWQRGEDGVPYRVAHQRSTVFVPAAARTARIPLRALPPGRELRVELMLDGHAADVIVVPRDRWYDLRLLLPEHNDRTRFRRLDIRVADAESINEPLLMIGKIEPR